MSLALTKPRQPSGLYAGGQAVCSLPTGTGKTLVAVLWLTSLFEAGKVILELIRLLVSQTTDHLFDKARVDCVPMDGRIPPVRRKELWQCPVVVAMPETTLNDIEHVHFVCER